MGVIHRGWWGVNTYGVIGGGGGASIHMGASYGGIGGGGASIHMAS